MNQNVQNLIDKIKSEGLQQSEAKAREMEAAVQKKADQVVKAAEERAAKILADAKQQKEQLEQSGQAALQQAARNVVLTLKATISTTMDKIIAQSVNEAMTPEALASVITDIGKSFLSDHSADSVRVALSKKDAKAFNETMISKLQKSLKKDVAVVSDDDVSGGFTISFDEGKSSFDFSEKALSDYLKTCVSDKLAELLD